VSAAREVGSEKQAKAVSGTAKRAVIATQPRLWRFELDNTGRRA
jgi:hypothetical protein